MRVKVPLELDDTAIAELCEQIGAQELVSRFHHNEILDHVDPQDLLFYIKDRYDIEEFIQVWVEEIK